MRADWSVTKRITVDGDRSGTGCRLAVALCLAAGRERRSGLRIGQDRSGHAAIRCASSPQVVRPAPAVCCPSEGLYFAALDSLVDNFKNCSRPWPWCWSGCWESAWRIARGMIARAVEGAPSWGSLRSLLTPGGVLRRRPVLPRTRCGLHRPATRCRGSPLRRRLGRSPAGRVWPPSLPGSPRDSAPTSMVTSLDTILAGLSSEGARLVSSMPEYERRRNGEPLVHDRLDLSPDWESGGPSAPGGSNRASPRQAPPKKEARQLPPSLPIDPASEDDPDWAPEERRRTARARLGGAQRPLPSAPSLLHGRP